MTHELHGWNTSCLVCLKSNKNSCYYASSEADVIYVYNMSRAPPFPPNIKFNKISGRSFITQIYCLSKSMITPLQTTYVNYQNVDVDVKTMRQNIAWQVISHKDFYAVRLTQGPAYQTRRKGFECNAKHYTQPYVEGSLRSFVWTFIMRKLRKHVWLLQFQ